MRLCFSKDAGARSYRSKVVKITLIAQIIEAQPSERALSGHREERQGVRRGRHGAGCHLRGEHFRLRILAVANATRRAEPVDALVDPARLHVRIERNFGEVEHRRGAGVRGAEQRGPFVAGSGEKISASTRACSSQEARSYCMSAKLAGAPMAWSSSR